MSPSPIHLQHFRAQIAKYVSFSDAEWNVFADHLYIRSLNKKQAFVEAGKPSREVGFILKGSFRFFFVKDGIEMSSYFSFCNEFVSAYGAFLRRRKSEITIDAMEDDSLLICFNIDSYQLLLEDNIVQHKMNRFGRLIAEELVCCYDERVMSFVTKTPEERYLMLLETGNQIIQNIPQHYLANYLGITPVSLSRIRKRIQSRQKQQKLAS